MRRLLKWGVPLALIAGLGLTSAVGSALTSSTNSQVGAFPAPAQDVRIPSSSGIELAGTYWPGSSVQTGAILLLHGNSSNRAGVSAYAVPLVAAGYSILAIDFRGHGESTPAAKSFGWFEAEDAHAALAWLKAKNPKSKLGAIGLSLGGAAAVLGQKGPLPVEALVLNAVYPDIRTAIHNRIAAHAHPLLAYMVEPLLSYQAIPRLGISPTQIAPIKALAAVKVPVMIVGGGEDRYTPPDETKAMFEAAGHNVLEGHSHHQAVGIPSPKFREKLLRFFERHLKKA